MRLNAQQGLNVAQRRKTPYKYKHLSHPLAPTIKRPKWQKPTLLTERFRRNSSIVISVVVAHALQRLTPPYHLSICTCIILWQDGMVLQSKNQTNVPRGDVKHLWYKRQHLKCLYQSEVLIISEPKLPLSTGSLNNL